MEYRLAEINDAEWIAEILQTKYGEHYKPIEFTPEFVKERLARENVFYVVAVDESGKVVGTVRATIVDVDLVELRHEVFPDKEIGKGLVEKISDILKEKKMRKVIARTIATDTLENEVYKELGWTQEGLFKDHYRKGTDIIQYAKFLE